MGDSGLEIQSFRLWKTHWAGTIFTAWACSNASSREPRQQRRIGQEPVAPRIQPPNKWEAKGEQWVLLTITQINTAATWRVDDVMLDPWIAR